MIADIAQGISPVAKKAIESAAFIGELAQWRGRLVHDNRAVQLASGADELRGASRRFARRSDARSLGRPRELMNEDAPEQRIVIINGLPGTGKSTIGRAVSEHFGWPLLSKDTFKEIMFDTLGWSDKEWSLKVSAATHRMMDYVIGESLGARHSLVVESNFKADLDGPRFERFRTHYGVRLVQILCWAEGDVLFERYKARLNSGRHPGHAEEGGLDLAKASLAAGRAEPLAILGPTIEIDTTHFEAIDYPSIFRSVSAS